MSIKQYIVFCISLLALYIAVSCQKDIGNYSYNEMNALDTVYNLPKEVVAKVGKPLEIKTDPKFALDPEFKQENYSFRWYYIGLNEKKVTTFLTLSTEKDLKLPNMGLAAGNYEFFYAITDKNTGVTYTQRFKLKVENEINEGWIMMNEANGVARVDMLVLNSQGGFDLYNNLLSLTGSELKLEGKPVMTYNYSTGLLIGPDQISFGLYLGTDKRTTKVEPNTFKWTYTMDLTYEMFGNIPPNFYAEVIRQKNGGASYMLGNENLYFYERARQIVYSAPLNYISEEKKSFALAPFIATDQMNSVSPAFLYDKTNRRFVKNMNGSTTCITIPDPTDKLFSFSTGMDVMHMRWMAFNGGEIFSVLKDPNSSKKYLARFNATSHDQTYYSEIIGTDIANAERFAFSPEFGYVFYTVGGKLYEYDMVYKTSKLMLDLGGQKISYLDFYEFKKTTKYKDSNKLMVGSYDPSKSDGTEGRLDIYTVPSLNDDLILDQNYSGFGRIKSLTYRER
ncbi:PKD-like family lipoprotein [Sphingobacterium faecale]|uniref:PKD family protein n=1 Tax=Sphingobacterium faecale TaxID=2803775 RepID=A0ABS1R422_9SPHI|nr:PKD-like family lipoprotein [Sphingobacterium faecale]MBL1409453.1 hypothetical protein [Sphingobacterium faecale]